MRLNPLTTSFLLTALVSSVLPAMPVRAQGQISLAFDTLPSEQGWAYSAGAPGDSTDYYSVDGTMLTQDTMSLPVGTGTLNGALWQRPNVVASSGAITLTVQARVTAVEGNPNDTTYGYGFAFYVRTGTESYSVGITPTEVRDGHLQVVFMGDNSSVSHEYRLEIDPGTGFTLYRDDVEIGAGTGTPSTASELLLGDASNVANARAEVSMYEFLQEGPTSIGGEAGVMSWGKVKARFRGVNE